ncbi:Sulfotransferase 1E1 [Halotydeus destructor]|nr:Sulfotransferase 1E1 [Halotydeus destructor]
MARLPSKTVRGSIFPIEFPTGSLEETLDYVARDGDLFITTYPKCGTTWMQQIVTLLFNNGKIEGEDTLEKGLFTYIPFLEAMGTKSLAIKRPIAMKTHLPFNLQPFNVRAKYIIVLRNPKDVCVSLYYHKKLAPLYPEIFETYTMQVHIEAFLKGEIPSGSYFDWVSSWWSQRDNPNIKFFIYEDMKTKPRENIVEVAKFIGLEDKLKNQQLLSDVLENSSLSHMKVNTNSFMKKQFSMTRQKVIEGDFTFIRKGEIGDYRNHFTTEDNDAFNKVIAEKFAGTGLEHLWDEYDVKTM